MTAGLAASFDPLVDRIYEVLCDGRGAYRTIASGSRFIAKALPGESDQVRAKNSRVQKIALVAIDSFTDSANTQETSDRAEYQAAIRVDLAYHTSNPYQRSAVIAQMTAAASDAHLVRAALGWPANMPQTQDARDTGVQSGLVFKSMSGGRLSPDSRLFTVTLAFTAAVWLAMPTA